MISISLWIADGVCNKGFWQFLLWPSQKSVMKYDQKSCIANKIAEKSPAFKCIICNHQFITHCHVFNAEKSIVHKLHSIPMPVKLDYSLWRGEWDFWTACVGNRTRISWSLVSTLTIGPLLTATMQKSLLCEIEMQWMISITGENQLIAVWLNLYSILILQINLLLKHIGI